MFALVLIFARILMAILPLAYIHPDEFHQCTEPAARLIDILPEQTQVHLAWEFRALNRSMTTDNAYTTATAPPFPPIRSIPPIFLACGLPRQIMSLALSTFEYPPSPYMSFLAPRILLLIMSLAHDILLLYTVTRMFKTLENIDAGYTTMRIDHRSLRIRSFWLIVTSSAVSLVMRSHSFSQSLESFLLSLAIFFSCRPAFLSAPIVSTASLPSLRLNLLAFGAVTAFGCFTRISFAAFAAPFTILLIYLTKRREEQIIYMQTNVNQTNAQQLMITQNTSTTLIYLLLQYAFYIVNGFLIIAVICIVTDSIVYGSLIVQTTFDNIEIMFAFVCSFIMQMKYDNFIITPIYNLLYNANIDNLARHGLHPRWTHIMVNAPMLYGPLIFLFIYEFWQRVITAVVTPQQLNIKSTNINKTADDEKSMQNGDNENAMVTACIVSVLLSVFLMSIAPHQEPRFLYPLLAPLAIAVGDKLFFDIGNNGRGQFRTALVCVWLLQQLVLLILFGVLHQGGVVRAMLNARGNIDAIVDKYDNSDVTTQTQSHLVFYHTYSLPISLFQLQVGTLHEHSDIISDAFVNISASIDADLHLSAGHVSGRANVDVFAWEMTSGDLRALTLFFASLRQTRLNVFNAAPQSQPSAECLSCVLLYAPASINLPNTLSDNDDGTNHTSFDLLELPNLHIAGHLTTEDLPNYRSTCWRGGLWECLKLKAYCVVNT